MHIALPGTGSRPVAALVAASPRRPLDGQHLLIAVIAGVTWLALIGGVLSSDILSNGSGGGAHHHSLPSYAAYNTQEVAPTSFRSLSVTHAELTPPGRLARGPRLDAVGQHPGCADRRATVDLAFLALCDAGLLWLEYRDPAGQWPIRVVLGSARTAQPPAAGAPGDVQ